MQKNQPQQENLSILPQEKGERTMQKYVRDEKNGIEYELIGDYYYPCLKIEELPSLCKYGRLRLKFLKEYNKNIYTKLFLSRKLNEHLIEIDTQARNMIEYLTKEMAKRQGITEQLKAKDMMRWIRMMNDIRACVDEIVLSDIVYS